MTNPTPAALLDALKIAPQDMKHFNRFCECCEDFDSGGYDVPKDAMRRLAEIGLVRSTGFGRYETTMIGDAIRSAANAHPVQAEQTARVGEVPEIAEAIDTAKQVIEELTSTHISAAIVGEKCPTMDYITNYERVIRARQFLEYTLLPMLEQFSAPAAHTAQSTDNQLSASAGEGGSGK